MIISVHKLTIIAGLIAFCTIITTYLVSTLDGLEPFFMPTISSTGDDAPQAGIFVYGLSWTAFLLLLLNITIYRRFIGLISEVQLGAIDSTSPFIAGWLQKNKIQAFFGVVAAFGLHLLASFRSNATPSVHFFGAGLLFFSTWAWMVMNCNLGLSLRRFGPEAMKHFSIGWKIVATTLCSAAATGLALCTIVALADASLKTDAWKAFALFEWLFVFALALFTLSFWSDFAKFNLAIDLEAAAPQSSFSPSIQTPLLPQTSQDQRQ